MKRSSGFTIIELATVLVALLIGGLLFYSGSATANAAAHDTQRKVAINAMYYNLEEAYYPAHSYYPSTIDSKTLRAMDPTLFTDPSGIKLNTAGSTLHYKALDCDTNGHCKSYRLSADLQREAEYVKESMRS